MDYQNSLNTVAANAHSFTHVSPSLYNVNYAYSSGVAQLQGDNGPDNFDGLSSAQVASRVHGMGMKCIPLIQAGAGNGGTDQGIQNIVANSPSGAQHAFITAMVQEAVSKGYDGYSLDWETGGGTTYAGYGQAMTSFLGAFQSALHQHGMVLQLVVGGWFVHQSNCSGNAGFVDLQAAAQNVDQVIMMSYDTALGSPPAQCNMSVSNPQNCGGDFASDLNLMCAYVPLDKINMGYDSDPAAGNNDVAGATVSATEKAGITAVSIWPEYNTAGSNGSYVLCDTSLHLARVQHRRPERVVRALRHEEHLARGGDVVQSARGLPRVLTDRHPRPGALGAPPLHRPPSNSHPRATSDQSDRSPTVLGCGAARRAPKPCAVLVAAATAPRPSIAPHGEVAHPLLMHRA
jgi:hypothetical protein